MHALCDAVLGTAHHSPSNPALICPIRSPQLLTWPPTLVCLVSSPSSSLGQPCLLNPARCPLHVLCVQEYVQVCHQLRDALEVGGERLVASAQVWGGGASA